MNKTNNLDDLPPIPSVHRSKERVKKHGALDTAKTTFGQLAAKSSEMSKAAGTTEQPLAWWTDGFATGWRLAHGQTSLASEGTSWPTTVGEAEDLGNEVFEAAWPVIKAIIQSWTHKTEHQLIAQQLKEELKRINGDSKEDESV